MTKRELQAKGLTRREAVNVHRLVKGGAEDGEAIQKVLAERGKKLAPKAK
jgi:hypothetical protein